MAKRELVNQIVSMVIQGFNERDILDTLKEEGNSYTDIKDALDQAQTKIELARAAGDEGLLYEEEEEEPRKKEKPRQKMGKSIMSQPRAPLPRYQETEAAEETGEAEERGVEEGIPAPGGTMQQAYYQQQEEYPAQKFAYQPQEADVSELDEMVEEIVNEKIREIETKIGNLDSFKQGIQKDIRALDNSIGKFDMKIKEKDVETLSRIQEIMLEIKSINSEIIALENAFLKILSPLVSNMKDIDKIAKAAQTLDFRKAKDMEKLTETIEAQKKKREEKRGKEKDSLDKLIKR